MSGQRTQSDPLMVPALTAWGEARGEGEAGMQAVLNVVARRAKLGGWWGETLVEVCKKPWQFSCWNPGADLEAIRRVSPNDPQLVLARALTSRLLNGELTDLTEGADSYYAISIRPPAWAAKARFTVQIGHQKFYRTRALLGPATGAAA